MAAFRESLRLDPNYAPAHNRLGRGLLMLRRFEEAYKVSERLEALDRNLADLLETEIDVSLTDALPD